MQSTTLRSLRSTPLRSITLRSIWHAGFVVGLAALMAPGPAHLPTPLPAQFYDLTIATDMPNLRENLRYAVVRRQQCLARSNLGSAFSMLSHPSLAGCKLHEQSHDADSLFYVLNCEHSSGTTGTARWEIGERTIHGTLEVKLGGKNMTFDQRVRATLIGACPSIG